MNKANICVLGVVLAMSACGARGFPSESDAAGDASPVDSSDGNTPDGAGPTGSIFAHSSTALFAVNPQTLVAAHLVDFSFAGADEAITDIAVDRSGTMIGISMENIYRIDTTTGFATLLAAFTSESGFTALSFVPENPFDENSAEVLLTADFDGDVYRISEQTGNTTLLGNFGGGIGSSGDLVSIQGFGTVATVNVEGEDNDYLAWINPTTYQASLIGTVGSGYDRVFGVAFWGGHVYGFVDDGPSVGSGRIIEFNMTNGVATPLAGSVDAVRWFGAGVTTAAPVTVD